MKLSVKFQALTLFALASIAFSAPQITAPEPNVGAGKEVAGALYLMSNYDFGNSILVYDISSDGTIRYNKSYRTSGRGAGQIAIPQIADALRTEGSIYVTGDRLFHVNAGSDTIEMWSINPNDPSELKQIGKPVHSGGNFPATVHVSPKSGNVCVANAGTLNGVNCFRQTVDGLVAIPGSQRFLGFNQTTPPTFGTTVNSMSTVLFTRDGSKLLADVKGLTVQGIPGYIAAWNVNEDGSLSEGHDLYPAPSTIGALNFGMSYLPDGYEGFILADPTVGGIVYDFSKGYGPGEWRAKNIPLEGQNTTCWASYASKSDSYFFSDFGAQIVFEAKIDLDTLESQVVNRFQLDPIKTVNIDHRVVTIGDNQFLYQLAPYGNLITVFDIQPEGKTKIIQSYNYSSPLLSNRVGFTNLSPQGLAYHLKN